MDPNRKITKKFTKKFDSKVINRKYFRRKTRLKTALKLENCSYKSSCKNFRRRRFSVNWKKSMYL